MRPLLGFLGILILGTLIAGLRPFVGLPVTVLIALAFCAVFIATAVLLDRRDLRRGIDIYPR